LKNKEKINFSTFITLNGHEINTINKIWVTQLTRLGLNYLCKIWQVKLFGYT